MFRVIFPVLLSCMCVTSSFATDLCAAAKQLVNIMEQTYQAGFVGGSVYCQSSLIELQQTLPPTPDAQKTIEVIYTSCMSGALDKEALENGNKPIYHQQLIQIENNLLQKACGGQ